MENYVSNRFSVKGELHMKKGSIKQAIRFSAVGLLNTAVDYIVFYIVLVFLNVDKSIAQICATACAMCVSYIVNKNWTFHKKGKAPKRQIVKFIITNLVSMGCTIIFMNVFHDVLHIHLWLNNVLKTMKVSYVLDGDMGVMFCKIVASLLSFVINFIGNKFWVFTDNKK